MSISNYLENKLVGLVCGAISWTPPSSMTVHLYTSAPGDTGGGTEVSTGVWTNYSAPSITNDSTGWIEPSDGVVANAAEVSFGIAAISGTPPVVTHVAIKDGTNFLLIGALAVAKTINNGDPVKFEAEQITFSLD